MTDEKDITGLVVIDPYNDFISEGGKIWNRIKCVAEAKATADYSDVEMHAALDINIPNYASAIVTTNEIVEAIASLQNLRIIAHL